MIQLSHIQISILFLCVLCSCGTTSSPDLIMHGAVEESTDDLELYLFESRGNVRQKVDTIEVRDGKFEYSMKLKESPVQFRLANNQNRSRKDFWVEKGELSFKGSASNFGEASVTGMGFQKEEENFLLVYDRSESIEKQIERIKKHIEAPSAIYNLYRIYRDVPLEELRSLLSKIDIKWHDHDYVVTMSNYLQLERKDPPRKDAAYIDFVARDKENERVQLSHLLEHSNKEFFLLEFKNLYCPHSTRAMPELSDINDEFGEVLELISFITDTREFLWERYLSRDSTEWMKLWDGQGERGETCISYGAKGSPYYYLMDRQGVILNYWFGYEEGVIHQEIRKKIKEL